LLYDALMMVAGATYYIGEKQYMIK
jgi:hypothetical protein